MTRQKPSPSLPGLLQSLLGFGFLHGKGEKYRGGRPPGTIIEILDDRKKATLKEWLNRNQSQRQAVRSVSMDMWEPFINAVRETINGAGEKICFDRFHVAVYFGKALDKIRATEHRELRREGISPLSRTRHN